MKILVTVTLLEVYLESMYINLKWGNCQTPKNRKRPHKKFMYVLTLHKANTAVFF